MLLTIIKREFLSNLLTFRFLIGFVLCSGLVVGSAYVLTQDYSQRLQNYALAIQGHTNDLREVKLYSYLKPQVDRKPEVLSIFNVGVDKTLGNTVQIGLAQVPAEAEGGYTKDNPYLDIFPSFDLTLVISTVMSLLALLFVYDSVSGERENGTLKLVLSNPASRSTILLGKYLGGMLSLLLPLTASFIFASLVVLTTSEYVSFNSADWWRIWLIFLVSVLYISVFFTLGLFLSSRTQRASTTLMFGMFLWAFFVVIFPNASVFIVDRISPIEPEENVEAQIDQLWQDFHSEVARFLRRRGVETSEPENATPSSNAMALYNLIRTMPGIQGLPSKMSWSTGWAQESFMFSGFGEEARSFVQEYVKFKEPLRIDYAQRAWQIRRDYLNRNHNRQTALARSLSRVSPAAIYEDTMASLARTSLADYEDFMERARRYREELIEYLRSRSAFASAQWFSPDSGAVNVGDLPRFDPPSTSFSESLQRGLEGIVLLLILNVFFFMAAYLSFLRYDAR